MADERGYLSRKEYARLSREEWKELAFWRDILAEFWGTFMLVGCNIATALTWHEQGVGTVVQVGLAMTYVTAASAWSVGHYGGCFMNPSVAFALALAVKITWIKCLIFWIVECTAGIAAAAFIQGITPSNYTDNLGATTLGPDVLPWQGVFWEGWITANLCMVVLGSINTVRKPDLYVFSVPIGMALAMGILCAFKPTGGSMNLARSLGPAVLTGIWDDFWVYIVGPLGGALFAGIFYPWVLDIVKKPKHVKKQVMVLDNDITVSAKELKLLLEKCYTNGGYDDVMSFPGGRFTSTNKDESTGF